MRWRFSLRTALIGIAVAATAMALYRYAFPPPAVNIPVLTEHYETTYFFHACGKTYEYQITADLIAKSPTWDRRNPHPPLSPNLAIIYADQLRLRWVKEGKIPEHYESDTHWEVRSVQLTPANRTHWYWLVTFEHGINQTSGPTNEFIVPVLMNGAVIEPKLEAEDAENLKQ